MSLAIILSSTAAGIAALFFLKKYFNGGVCTNRVRLNGKVAIITGANAGIGKETALELARRGATVVMACRDVARATRAADDIRRQLGSKCNVFVHQLDLSSLESVHKFAKTMNEELDAIHLLINNAGVAMPSYTETVDGFEMTMGTNHLGHFLLTNLLLDKMKQSAPSRIINVSSMAYERATLNVDNLLTKREEYGSLAVYGNSKLANVLFTKELAQRLRGSGIVTYSLHPGGVRTEFISSALNQQKFLASKLMLRILYYTMMPLIWLIFKDSRHGAQTTIYCATEPQLDDEKWSGCYFSDCAVKKLLPHAEDMHAAKRLWSVSEKLSMNRIIETN